MADDTRDADPKPEGDTDQVEPDEVEVEVYDLGPAGYTVTATDSQRAVRPKTHFWWSFFLPGAAFTLVGVAIMVWPKGSIQLFTTLLGVLVAFTGIMFITGSFQAKRAFGKWGVGLPFGLVLLAFGAVSVVFAGPVARFWIVVWAVAAVLSGVWDVASAIMNDQHGRWIRLARGVILAVAGAGVLVAPLLGYLFLGLAIGISCMLIGISTIAMGLAVRRAEI